MALFYYVEIENKDALQELVCQTRDPALPPLTDGWLPRPRLGSGQVAAVFLPMHLTLIWAKRFIPEVSQSEDEWKLTCAALAARIKQGQILQKLHIGSLVHTATACVASVSSESVADVPYEGDTPTLVLALRHDGGERAPQTWPRHRERLELLSGPDTVQVDFLAVGVLKLAACLPDEPTSCTGKFLRVETAPCKSVSTEPCAFITILLADMPGDEVGSSSRVWASRLTASVQDQPLDPMEYKIKAKLQKPGHPGHVYIKWSATHRLVNAYDLLDILERRFQSLMTL